VQRHCSLKWRNNSGFTLFELLLVIVIIGVVVGGVVLSGGLAGDDRILRRELQNTHALIKLSCDEAVMRNQMIGALVGQNNVSFFSWNGDFWEVYPETDTLRPRLWSDGVSVSLDIDGLAINLSEPASINRSIKRGTLEQNPLQSQSQNQQQPQILCFSNGTSRPFKLSFQFNDFRQSIESDGYVIKVLAGGKGH